MSKYTTEVRFICETAAGLRESAGLGEVNTIIQKAIPSIFDFQFPMFDETYRNVLCTKILRHYYTREIGLETVGLWKLRLETKLNEIMPYYNKLYEVAASKFNPLWDTDVTTTHEGSRNDDGSSNTNSSMNGTSWNLFSDTPQGSLQNVENEEYLTNATKDTNSSNGNVNGTTKLDSTENYVTHVGGKTGGITYGKMLQEFRNNLWNIDMDIIYDLEPLFMGLW